MGFFLTTKLANYLTTKLSNEQTIERSNEKRACGAGVEWVGIGAERAG